MSCASRAADAAAEGPKHNYREILLEKCQYKEVVPLNNANLSNLIHLNFRIMFLKVRCCGACKPLTAHRM